MARALKFAWDCGRAWLLLLPDFVSRKSYYKELSQSAPAAAAPWFIGPRHSLCDLACAPPHRAVSPHAVVQGTRSLRRERATLAAASSMPTFATFHLTALVCSLPHFSASGFCIWPTQVVNPTNAFGKPCRQQLSSVAGRAIRARIDNRPLELRSYVTADSVDQVLAPAASPPPTLIPVCCQLPQLAKPAEKPHRPWRKKAQRERKRMRQDK